MVVRLRFAPSSPAPVDLAADDRIVITDTTWMAPGDEHVVGLRELVEAVTSSRNLSAEATALLDRWASASGVVEAMTVEGVSFWYGLRLGCWLWLSEQLLWLGVIDEMLARHPAIGEITCDPEGEPSLAFAARLAAERSALRFAEAPAAPRSLGLDASADDPTAAEAPAAMRSTPRATSTPGQGRRSLVGRVRWRFRPPEVERRRRLAARRLAAIASDPINRLLVVQAHARQRIDTVNGPRFINPFLGPVIDRLRGTRLEPFEVDLRATVDGDVAPWRAVEDDERGRSLPIDVAATLVRRVGGPVKPRTLARERADTLLAAPVPLAVSGVDLGPELTRRVADRVSASLGRSIVDVQRLRALLRHAHPAGILLADEYHRQDWLAAAGAEGVPVAAVQHGVISPWHTGYVHASRPAQLRLPGRTFVFGSWERDLLVEGSAYQPDEVAVAGSPRLDLVEPGDRGGSVEATADLRRELGVAPGHRMIVLSGTWGVLHRRFQYPIALGRLFGTPLERVHVVVKLHPSEKDEGPYRSVIEGIAEAGGFVPPPVTIVQSIDLYRLLEAADAHLGIQSTVLTEAVVTGTPNLLAAGMAGSDLLGYVDAGVAVAVRSGADMLAVLDRPRAEVMLEADRAAFLRIHFEPGDASGRIADQLLDWML